MADEIQLTKSDEVASLLEHRFISDDVIKQVISDAEATGEKFFQPDSNRYLAKKQIGNATCYVEYSVADGNYIVHTAYSHSAQILGVQ